MRFYFNQIYFRIKGKNPIYEIFLKGKIVLDLGCGEGNLLKQNKEKISGVDLNKIEIAKLKKKGYRVKLESVYNTSFNNNEFDSIISDNVIEHLYPDEAYKMFIEMKRLLKPHGRIYLKTPLPNIIRNTFGHIKPYTPKSIKKLFRKNSRETFNPINGLSVVRIYYYGHYSQYKALFLINYLLGIIFKFMRTSFLIIIEKDEK